MLALYNEPWRLKGIRAPMGAWLAQGREFKAHIGHGAYLKKKKKSQGKFLTTLCLTHLICKVGLQIAVAVVHTNPQKRKGTYSFAK